MAVLFAYDASLIFDQFEKLNAIKTIIAKFAEPKDSICSTIGRAIAPARYRLKFESRQII